MYSVGKQNVENASKASAASVCGLIKKTILVAIKVHIYRVFQGLKFLAQPQCSLHRGQNLILGKRLTFLPLLMNYLEFQTHFTQAGTL